MRKPCVSVGAAALIGVLSLACQAASARLLEPMEAAWNLPFQLGPTLSQATIWVSRIAFRHGDRNFLVVDKMSGRLALFLNGEAVFSAPVLTGSSLADRLPEDAVYKTFAQQHGQQYRVTPAGRFTVSPAHDRVYGTTLDLNEIQGRDWRIAIHIAPEVGNRDARLRSPLRQDKHVTEGCINVEPETMRQLIRLLSGSRRTAIYILPMDEDLITRLF